MKRIEIDCVGEVEVENIYYYGVQTKRALENFPITNIKTSVFPEFINAFAKVKKSAALANFELGLLDEKIKNAICSACDKLLNGEFHDQFVIDPIQGGAGTSMNMNANEVIANVGLEIMGHKKGEYEFLSPNDHVNMSQSTNDTYPSSIKIALDDALDGLFVEMDRLVKSFKNKGEEFKDVIKVGRTQLQDAVPMTLGQGFNNYAHQVEFSIEGIKECKKILYGLNMGATAIGSGITCHPSYSKSVEKHIKKVVRSDFYILEDLFLGTQDASGFAYVSGSLKRFAMQLSKIANDLRLLSSGPRTGLGEIILPAKQPGSSIMPGKINPVIPEVVNQVCFQVAGFDTAISFCVEGGQLELNAFEPLIAFNLLTSISMLRNAINTLVVNCVDGITADVEKCRQYAETNISIVTALNPYIGYKKTTEIAKLALKENKSVHQVVLDLKLMEEDKLKEILDIKKMTKPH